jgi:hypothetical protein
LEATNCDLAAACKIQISNNLWQSLIMAALGYQLILIITQDVKWNYRDSGTFSIQTTRRRTSEPATRDRFPMTTAMASCPRA